jgi:hypothetical protein
MARNKRRLRKRKTERDIWAILNRPRPIEDYRRQLAWKKQERLRFGRIYPDDDAYVAWLEQETGTALEDAKDEWLTTCFGEPAPKF